MKRIRGEEEEKGGEREEGNYLEWMVGYSVPKTRKASYTQGGFGEMLDGELLCAFQISCSACSAGIPWLPNIEM